jgi:hypothetical protein
LSPAQIDQLVAPIALYPDPLLAQIFPATTYPQDLQDAQRWLQANPNPSEDAIDAQPWDPSVKALVHYPQVLKMLTDQMDITEALGAAFTGQQQDVLDSVQRLRGQAVASQSLQSTPQQQVLTDGGAVRIEPTSPDVVYVPVYDPAVVYYETVPITYFDPYPLGFWCDFDFDWGRRCVLVGDGWYRRWRHPRDWDRRLADRERDRQRFERQGGHWREADGRPAVWRRDNNKRAPRISPQVAQRLRPDREVGRGNGNGRGGVNNRGGNQASVQRQLQERAQQQDRALRSAQGHGQMQQGRQGDGRNTLPRRPNQEQPARQGQVPHIAQQQQQGHQGTGQRRSAEEAARQRDEVVRSLEQGHGGQQRMAQQPWRGVPQENSRRGQVSNPGLPYRPQGGPYESRAIQAPRAPVVRAPQGGQRDGGARIEAREAPQASGRGGGDGGGRAMGGGGGGGRGGGGDGGGGHGGGMGGDRDSGHH